MSDKKCPECGGTYFECSRTADWVHTKSECGHSACVRHQLARLEQKLSDFACYVLSYLEDPMPANTSLVQAAVAKELAMKLADVPDPLARLQAVVDKTYKVLDVLDADVARADVKYNSATTDTAREYWDGRRHAAANAACKLAAVFPREPPVRDDPEAAEAARSKL